MEVFGYRHPPRKVGRESSLTDTENGNRPDVRGQAENGTNLLLIKCSHPAGTEMYGMTGKHQISAGNGCVLYCIQYTTLTIP